MLKRTATAVLFALLAALPAQAQDKTIIVFAAASMKNAIDDIDAAFTKATSIKAVASLAASSALAKQIEQGAPADLFASADLEWMDYLANKKLIGQGFDIAKLAGDGRIAVADVRAVPAGKYAKAALEKLGGWPAAEPKLASAENVRAALALVGRGEAPLGIVYETDAKIEKNVKIVGHFPEGSHPPITYPVAVTKDAKPEAERYLNFLRSGVAKTIFETYGFTFLIKPVS